MKHRLAIVGALLLTACASPHDPLPLGDGALDCAQCHEAHVAQWQLGSHARSADSPILAAMLPEVERAWGSAARDRCIGCHAPGHGSDRAIGCLSCHAAVGNHAERDGLLAVDPRAPLTGPFDDPAPTPAHRSRTSAFLTSPSLCGTCHELTGPALVDEPTLTEYRASPAARAGVTCVDCHMPREAQERALVPNGRARPVRAHGAIGFDPPYGASEAEAFAAAERTRALLASALQLRVEASGDGVDVVVANVGAGHHVPTGAAFLRDLYVDVVLDGHLASRVLEIGDRPHLGERPVPLLTDADRVVRGSLAPGEERRVHLTTHAARIEATLYGRAVRADILDALALPHLATAIPTHTVAESRWLR